MRKLLAAIGCFVVAGLIATSRSQTTQPTTQASPTISDDAKSLLAKVDAAYQGLKTLQVGGTLSFNIDGGGQKRSEQAEITGFYESPNKFRHDLKSENTVVSNGTKLYAYLNAHNSYLLADAPKTKADPLPEDVGMLLMDQDPSLLLAIVADAATTLTTGATAVTKEADTTLDGKTYPTLKIVANEQDTFVAVDPASGLVRQMKHDMSRSFKAQGVADVKSALVTLDYPRIETGGSTDAQAIETAVAWTPPADAKPLAAGGGDDDSGSPAMALVGKAAPALSLKALDGSQFSLEAMKGHVVILDFWATWCGPCRMGLPILDKVAKARTNDVKVFAVNVQEEAGDINKFVKETSLGLPIVLDSDGKAGEAYKATGIPETIVVGKNGVVQKVIVGFHPDEEKELNDAIDAANKG